MARPLGGAAVVKSLPTVSQNRHILHLTDDGEPVRVCSNLGSPELF